MAGTLKDIARELNLSISTVSYALNDGPKPVSESVKARVQQLAGEIGYKPNRIARSLVTRRSGVIGVVPLDLNMDSLLQPYVVLAVNGIFNEAAKLKQDVLVFTAHDRNKPHTAADDILDCRADGVVFVSPRPDSPALHRIVESRLPHAIIGEDCGTASFVIDNALGSRMAIDHLIGLGHRHIAHLTGDFALSDASIRSNAYVEHMKAQGLTIYDGYLMRGNYWRETGYQAGFALTRLNPRPTAIFCSNDAMAIGLIDALHQQGLRCPHDVSVVGFDNAPTAGMINPPLTTISQPVQEMAAAAFREVVQGLQQETPVHGRKFSPELIVRGSTARAARVRKFAVK